MWGAEIRPVREIDNILALFENITKHTLFQENTEEAQPNQDRSFLFHKGQLIRIRKIVKRFMSLVIILWSRIKSISPFYISLEIGRFESM